MSAKPYASATQPKRRATPVGGFRDMIISQTEQSPTSRLMTMDGVSPIEADEAERLALEAAIAAARNDPRPSVSHEDVRSDIPDESARARRKIQSLAGGRLAG
jgi:hypothetical protein